MDIVLLIGSLVVILIAAELFTNGIEWFGHKLNLAEGAVGSVLASKRHTRWAWARSWAPPSCSPRWP